MTRVIAEELNLDRENSKKNPEIGLEMRIISAKWFRGSIPIGGFLTEMKPVVCSTIQRKN